MGWLRKRFGEPSTLAGLGIIFAVGIPLVPVQYQLLAQGTPPSGADLLVQRDLGRCPGCGGLYGSVQPS